MPLAVKVPNSIVSVIVGMTLIFMALILHLWIGLFFVVIIA